MPRMLLIRPLCEGDELEFAEPLGIERLAGYARAHGVVDVAILDRRLYEQERHAGLSAASLWSDVRATCDAAPPELVGFSLMTSQDVPDTLRMHSRLRAWYPNARFWAGGVYVTTAYDEAARLLPASIALVRGEGETALLDELAGGGHTSMLHPNEWAPAYRPHMERYATLGCSVNLQTSRGCPGSCAFCATPQLPYGLGTWRGRDISLVVDEIEHEQRRLAHANLPPVFNFVDDDFGPLRRLEELACELRERGLRISFACEMRLASLVGQSDLYSRMERLHEAGLSRLFVGVESLSPHTLEAWHKSYDASRMEQAVAAIREAGIALQAGYIMWHARQTVTNALAEAKELWRLGLYTHQAAVSRLIVFPGCELAGKDAQTARFEAMDSTSEEFYERFRSRSEGLQARWIAAAVQEPYFASCDLLGIKTDELRAVQDKLAELNARSFELLMSLGG